jgi:predicted Zn-dependent protease
VRAKDPRVRQVTASLAASWQHVEILRGDGQVVRDIRPLVRVNVSVVVGDGDRQESGSHGVGGRKSFGEFLAEDRWQFVADEALRQALVNLDAIPRRPARLTSCCRPAGRASCCTRRSDTGSKATSTARRPPPSPG